MTKPASAQLPTMLCWRVLHGALTMLGRPIDRRVFLRRAGLGAGLSLAAA